MFERFSDGARRATALASQEARHLGHDFIGTEHLLLGLLALGEGGAFDALADLEVTYDDVERKVSARIHSSDHPSMESPPFTPLAKRALERALREQLQWGTELIETEHVLLGLVDVPDGGGARILSEVAGDLDQVRHAVQRRLGPPAGPRRDQTKAQVTGRSLRRWASHTGGVLFRAPASGAGPQVGEPQGAEPQAAEPQVGEPQGAEPQVGEPLVDEPVEAPVGSDTAEPLARGGELRCPSCEASLADTLRYRPFQVPRDREDDEDAEAWLSVSVVFCGRCGRPLGVA